MYLKSISLQRAAVREMDFGSIALRLGRCRLSDVQGRPQHDQRRGMFHDSCFT